MVTTHILWIVGALGAAKSDTSFLVWNRLRTAGTSIGRLDLDDVGMCHPQPVDDPENHGVKAAAMAAVWSTFRDHGAEWLVLSGSVNTREEARMYLSQMPNAAWTVCRLTVDRSERHRRIAGRAMLLGLSESAIALTRATSDEDVAEGSS